MFKLLRISQGRYLLAKFDTSTPMGKAMLFILMIFAQMERETISERVTDNYYERAKFGGWLGGPALPACVPSKYISS